MIAFKKANMPIRVAAEALKMDQQSVRVMIQMGIVDWGICWRSPGSKQYQYLVSPSKFYESTGFLWKEGLAEESDEI